MLQQFEKSNKNNIHDKGTGRNSKFEVKTDRTTHVRDKLAVFKNVSEM